MTEYAGGIRFRHRQTVALHTSYEEIRQLVNEYRRTADACVADLRRRESSRDNWREDD
ncbi:MAG: hypothetical protein V1932_05845 [Chloroflexota bacterium]